MAYLGTGEANYRVVRQFRLDLPGPMVFYIVCSGVYFCLSFTKKGLVPRPVTYPHLNIFCNNCKLNFPEIHIGATMILNYDAVVNHN